MNSLEVFASRFGAKIGFNPKFIVEKNHRFYLVNPRLKRMQSSFYYAGLYLGKLKNGVFFPSFNLLNLLANVAANKVVVDRKTAWLFICGRDIFASGVVKAIGSKHKGQSTLIINEFNECLGFGRITGDLEGGVDKVVIKNVLDVGDFLRREGRVE